jgi:quinolinate synthase
LKMSELQERIEELKKERNALVLAHFFQKGEVQDVADFVGSELEIVRDAVGSHARVVVVCGVRFIAEIISALCPRKTVLMPDTSAECPLAAMVEPSQVSYIREGHPGVPVVSFIKSTFATKGETDYCLPSEGIVDAVASLPGDEVIFLPDKHLGDYLEKETGKKLISAQGYCPPHIKILPSDIEGLKDEHPDALVVAGPQCREDVLAMADFIGGTRGIMEFVGNSDYGEFIVATEVGFIYSLEKTYPEKAFYPASPWAVCKNHKRNDQEKILWALEDNVHVVNVPEEMVEKARGALKHLGI